MNAATTPPTRVVAAHLAIAGPAIATATRHWLTQGAELVRASVLGAPLSEAPLSDEAPAGARRWPGPAGAVWAETATHLAWSRDFGRYTDRRWAALLAAVDQYPEVLALTAYRQELLDDGQYYPGFPRFSLSARPTTRRTGEWWGLKAQLSEELFTATEPALLDLIRSTANLGPPGYGEISFDNTSHLDHATSFEHNLGRFPWRTVDESDTTLRGYSWLTIAPAAIGDRLGGATGLSATGAFAVVDRLAGGAYWLLATPHWRDYGPEQAAAVQAVLAPALPPGQPRPDLDGEAPHRLALVDAHPDRPRVRHTDDADIFQQRVDARDTTAYKVAVALRMSTLADRYPHALIWGVTGHESGPHLVCWDAAPDEVWVWQVLPTDDPYAGLDLTTDLRPLVAAVALDPLSAGRSVRPGPTFAGLGLPGQQSTADGSFAARGLIRVSDAGPGRQFFAAEPGRPAAEARRHTADVMRRADALRAAVLAAAPMVSALRLDRGETAGWLRP